MRAAGRWVVVSAGIAGILAALYFLAGPDGNALANIIDSRCGLHGQPANIAEPCLKVDQAAGYVVLRDRKGSHHYLLLPTRPMAGIESAQLLDPSTPNYFRLAWENRRFLSGTTHAVEDADVLLAINSRYGRSQNQLHIHISCIAPQVRTRLQIVAREAGFAWRPVAGGLLSHDYWVRRAGEEEIRTTAPFRLLASGLPGASDAMGQFSIAMAQAPDGGFLLLATRLSLLDLNLASAEELQDHACGRQPS